jgi:hypothetical protein
MNFNRIAREWRKAVAQLKAKLAKLLPEPASQAPAALVPVPVRVTPR